MTAAETVPSRVMSFSRRSMACVRLTDLPATSNSKSWCIWCADWYRWRASGLQAFHNRVQLDNPLVLLQRFQFRRQLREVPPIPAGANFVKHFAQTVEVGLGHTWPFRREIAFGAYERAGSVHGRYQADICQLWQPIHENNIREFYVPVNQAALVQMSQRGCQGKGDLQTVFRSKASSGFEYAFQGFRFVARGINFLTSALVVG